MANLRNIEKRLRIKGIPNIEVTKDKGTFYVLHILKNGTPVPLFVTDDKGELNKYLTEKYGIAEEQKGKGWHGDTPRHRDAKLRAGARKAMNSPMRHADAPTMEKVQKFTEALHGSGINYDWHIEETKSSFRAYNRYDTMDEYGYYDRVVDFTVIFPKTEPITNFKLQFGDSYGARKYMLDDYLGDTIAYTLDKLGYG